MLHASSNSPASSAVNTPLRNHHACAIGFYWWPCRWLNPQPISRSKPLFGIGVYKGAAIRAVPEFSVVSALSVLHHRLAAVQAWLSRQVRSVDEQPVVGLPFTLEPSAALLAVSLPWVSWREVRAAASALHRSQCVRIAHGYFLALRCARLSGAVVVGRLRSVMYLMSGFHDASYNLCWS